MPPIGFALVEHLLRRGARSKPASVLRKVDLPAPFEPISAITSPLFTVTSMPNSAWKSP